jgi:hypothetical protein
MIGIELVRGYSFLPQPFSLEDLTRHEHDANAFKHARDNPLGNSYADMVAGWKIDFHWVLGRFEIFGAAQTPAALVSLAETSFNLTEINQPPQAVWGAVRR